MRWWRRHHDTAAASPSGAGYPKLASVTSTEPENARGKILRLLLALLQAPLDRGRGGSARLDLVPALCARQGRLPHLRRPARGVPEFRLRLGLGWGRRGAP